jgi:hypothetical protein
MVKLLLCKNIIHHKCVQCGIDIDYNPTITGYCRVCKATQRLRTLSKTTDLPFDFLMAAADFARVTYHLRETNA